MKNIILIIALSFTLAMTLPASAEDKRLAIELVVDDSALLTSPQEADLLKQRLLAQLKSLLKRREYANARLDVITTSLGRTSWVGELKDLRDHERALALVELIPSKPDYCNSLASSFAVLGNNIRQRSAEGFTHIDVLIFSSLIDTGGPCSEEVTITLPQLPPELDVSAELTARDTVKRVSFFWVNPHQLRIWSEKLRDMNAWASTSEKKFELLGEEETRFVISKGKFIGGRR